MHPDYRQHGMGLRLIAAGWALLQRLGFRMAIATVGMGYKQNRMLARTGLHHVKSVKPFYSETYTDKLCIMFARLDEPAEAFAPMIEEMSEKMASVFKELRACRAFAPRR